MIDWSKAGFHPSEMAGIAKIVIVPRMHGKDMHLQMYWLDENDNQVRIDSHSEIAETCAATSELGEF